MEVIINIGASGSGKTTWTTNFIQNNPNYVRINRDDIRKALKGTLDGYYKLSNLNSVETLINKIEDSIYIQALNRGFSVIIDNTNLKPSYIQRWVDFVKIYNESAQNISEDVTFRFKLFPENHSFTLKQRVASRDGLKIGDVAYIDKHVSSIRSAIAYAEDNYKDHVINE